MCCNLATIRNSCQAAAAAAALALLSVGVPGWTAVPVEESVAAPRSGSDTAVQPRQGAIDSRSLNNPSVNSQTGGTGDPGRLSELFYEMQVLQQEVQELRGQVEEQNHRLNRLARDQQEQYLDLDRRMQSLRGGAGSQSSPSDAPAGQEGPDLSAGGRSAPSASPGGGALSEREVYTAAFELMKQRQFDQSVQAFNQLVAEYPNGAYTPNAFYWLGELYIAQEQNERARQSFVQVVNLYPDHQKVPDALYKLGVVYHRLGDVERAREYLNQVRSEYPQSSAAGLAQTYLAEL